MNERFFDSPLSFINEDDDLSLPVSQNQNVVTNEVLETEDINSVEEKNVSQITSMKENANHSSYFPPVNPSANPSKSTSCKPIQGNGPFGFLNGIGMDDLIIIGLIFFLFYEDKEKNKDTMLLLAILFFAGILF